MKMRAWISLSAAQLGISEAAMRGRIYRSAVKMPHRVKRNRWWVEVIDPPLTKPTHP